MARLKMVRKANGVTPIESRITAGIARLSTALRAHAWAGAEKAGLTPTQSEILLLLQSRSVPLRLSLIAEQLAISAATASDAVSSLESKALVTKGRAADDGRALAVVLTAAGRRQANNASTWARFLVEAAEDLSASEQVVLLKLVVKLIQNLQDRGEIPTSRMCLSCKYFQPNASRDQAKPYFCGFVGKPFGEKDLRVDCRDHETREAA